MADRPSSVRRMRIICALVVAVNLIAIALNVSVAVAVSAWHLALVPVGLVGIVVSLRSYWRYADTMRGLGRG